MVHYKCCNLLIILFVMYTFSNPILILDYISAPIEAATIVYIRHLVKLFIFERFNFRQNFTDVPLTGLIIMTNQTGKRCALKMMLCQNKKQISSHQ